MSATHRNLVIVIGMAAALSGMPVNAVEKIGKVYPVVEPDMIEDIQRSLREKEKTGELAKLQKEAVQRSMNTIESPPPVRGLTRTQKARTFYWDPSIIADKTVRDPQGRIVVQEGTRVNPLDQVQLPMPLLFFDGSDPAQVKTAVALIQKHQGRVKSILTAGKPLEISRRWQFQVYFDQGGALVRKFGIRQVPAIVTQSDRKLRIDELEVVEQ